jgi:predicted negative regulator of RcsB-dependent stress response
VEIYQTESQQVEVIKEYLLKYKNFIISMLVIFIVIIAGGRYWHHHQQVQAMQASNLFQEMVVAEQNKDIKTVEVKGKLLMDGFKSTPYPQMAGLLLAKQAIADNKLDRAEELLQWVVSLRKAKGISLFVATERLARVMHERGKTDAALALLDKTAPDKSYISIIEEAKGDIYLAKGDQQKAKAAYLKALENVPAGVPAQLIQFKLLDLGISEQDIQSSEGEPHA